MPASRRRRMVEVMCGTCACHRTPSSWLARLRVSELYSLFTKECTELQASLWAEPGVSAGRGCGTAQQQQAIRQPCDALLCPAHWLVNAADRRMDKGRRANLCCTRMPAAALSNSFGSTWSVSTIPGQTCSALAASRKTSSAVSGASSN